MGRVVQFYDPDCPTEEKWELLFEDDYEQAFDYQFVKRAIAEHATKSRGCDDSIIWLDPKVRQGLVQKAVKDASVGYQSWIFRRNYPKKMVTWCCTMFGVLIDCFSLKSKRHQT